MSIVSRLERLEKVVVVHTPRPTLVYVLNPDLTDQDQQKAAMARYKAEHPGWEGDDFNFIVAVSEECKRHVEQIMNSEEPLNAKR